MLSVIELPAFEAGMLWQAPPDYVAVYEPDGVEREPDGYSQEDTYVEPNESQGCPLAAAYIACHRAAYRAHLRTCWRQHDERAAGGSL